MEKLTWLASERSMSQDGESEEENSQEENSEPEEEEEEEAEGMEALQKEDEVNDEAVGDAAEKPPSTLASPKTVPEVETSITPPENHPMTMDHAEKNGKKRKYCEDFLQYSFTSIITAGIEKRQCVICCDVPSVKSVKRNDLNCHFDSKHLSFAAKKTNYFRSKIDGFKKSGVDTCG